MRAGLAELERTEAVDPHRAVAYQTIAHDPDEGAGHGLQAFGSSGVVAGDALSQAAIEDTLLHGSGSQACTASRRPSAVRNVTWRREGISSASPSLGRRPR